MTTNDLAHTAAELQAITTETHSIYSECYFNGVKQVTTSATATNLKDATADLLDFCNQHPQSRHDFAIYDTAENDNGTTVTIEGTLSPTDGETDETNCVVIVFAIPHQQAA
ncbi:hypothetical protein TH728_05495 [Corynebacterium amycolatum]|uniref:hypothetical protein n=1 Tax=Corynebacterium TaxID=1716 RepID=UPI0016526A98|nr:MULTISPECIES: hypothetical protein [Corynebacterium]MBC6793753.1 hypothetical protein [Corynebacterium sp. LK26]MDY7341877.1 hypothetical protein [Corynebacterium amycolatum]